MRSRAPREVVGLVRAETCEWPNVIPRPRARKGAKGDGLKYEREFVRRLQERFPGVLHGQWFRFWDANGMGLAQPDAILVREEAVLVVECKLTDTEVARRQLARLYFPVLRHVFGKPVFGIVVVKHITPRSSRDVLCGSLAEALPLAPHGIPTLHWLGRTAL